MTAETLTLADAWLLHLEPRKPARWIAASDWPEGKAGLAA